MGKKKGPNRRHGAGRPPKVNSKRGKLIAKAQYGAIEDLKKTYIVYRGDMIG